MGQEQQRESGFHLQCGAGLRWGGGERGGEGRRRGGAGGSPDCTPGPGPVAARIFHQRRSVLCAPASCRDCCECSSCGTEGSLREWAEHAPDPTELSTEAQGHPLFRFLRVSATSPLWPRVCGKKGSLLELVTMSRWPQDRSLRVVDFFISCRFLEDSIDFSFSVCDHWLSLTQWRHGLPMGVPGLGCGALGSLSQPVPYSSRVWGHRHLLVVIFSWN